MSLRTWIEFSAAVGPGPRERIISLLEEAGIGLCTPGSSPGGGTGPLGVVVFDVVDEQVLATGRRADEGAGVLALSVGPGRLPSPVIWSIIDASSSRRDAVRAPDASRPESASSSTRATLACSASSAE